MAKLKYEKYHNKFGWCSYPFENHPLGYCWSFALWVDKDLVVKETKIETKEDLWKFCNEGCDCFMGGNMTFWTTYFPFVLIGLGLNLIWLGCLLLYKP